MFAVGPKYSDVLSETEKEFPGFSVVRKGDSRFMRFLSKILFFNKTFMTGFHTTVGNTLYVAPSWEDMSDEGRAALLRHERVHLRQQRRYTKVLFSLLYVLVLPVVFTFRAKFEREAYEESLRARLEYWGPEAFTEQAREAMIHNFVSGATYLWMWPFRARVARWYDAEVKKLLASD